MKRSLVFVILGAAASLAVVNSSQADGFIIFNTYVVGTEYIRYNSLNIPDTWHASIWYALGDVTGSVTGSGGGTEVPSGGGLTLYTGVNAVAPISSEFPGLINGESITIPGYTSGLVTFVIGVFNGADFYTSSLRGRSDAFTETLTTGINVPSAFQNFEGFNIIPEPSTYAMMGLGAMSLLALRRRK